MWLDIMVIMKEEQKKKWAFERKLKPAEASSLWGKVFWSARNTSAVMLDDDEDVDLSPCVVKIRRFLQETADF